MTEFICPVCGKILDKNEKSYVCESRHSFDISRKGTVNLLLSQKSRHGDDKLMVNARRSFLDKGYYKALLDVLCGFASETVRSGDTVLDCGCGECWYTANIEEYLGKKGIPADIIGIDVSKEAISAGASRSRSLRLAVASVFEIPVAAKTCDTVISLFAPFAPEEYRRVLKNGGYFLTAFPLEDHLWELKKAVYDEPYRNTVSNMEIDGFKLVKSEDIHETINLRTNEDIMSLFSMTPYYYKTSQADRDKLMKLSVLETQIEFRAALYKFNG